MKSIIEISIDELIADPYQPRKSFLKDELDRLAASIAARGVLMPIRVVRAEDRLYRIVTGESRWRAARIAGLATVPCLVVEGKPSETDLISDQLVENHVRSDLTAIEFARSLSRLKTLRGCTSQALADELGLSKASISRAEALLDLPHDIQALVDAGKLAESAAYELSRLPDEESQRTMLAELLAGRLTRDQLAESVRHRLKGKKATTSRLPFKLDGMSLTVTTGHALSWKDLAELIDRFKREIKKYAEGDGKADLATPLKLS